MKSDVSRTSGEQILENITRDEIDVDYYIRNVSVQTGEEFSPYFLQNLTHRRRMNNGESSSQEYHRQDSITLGRTQDCSQGFHGTITRIPSGNVIDQKRVGVGVGVGIQFNQNERYEYQMDDSTGGYYHKDYDIRGYNQHPQQQSSTYTNEIQIHKEKMKFLCSFGGRILTRANDGKLRYVGGETRIISIKKNLNYQELVKKTYTICKHPHVIKYQLPGEDLDALISVCSDEDFHHMIDEYHELEKGSKRLRIFLESLNSESQYSSENSYKYVASMNDVTIPSPLKSSIDSITSLENETPSSSNVAKMLLNPTQLMKSPSFQYRDPINSQLKVNRDQIEQPLNENNPFLIHESSIQSEIFFQCHQQSHNVRNNSSSLLNKLEDFASFVQQEDMIKEKTQIYKCENQETIKWMEKNNLNLGYDIEEHHHNLSPATPLERQLSMATTVSSDGLQHNTENPRIGHLEFNENDHFTHDFIVPNSTGFASISSDVSLGESFVDNLGNSSRSQTSEDIIDSLPLDIILSTKELLCMQDIHKENESVSQFEKKNVKDDKRMTDGSISDATIAEIQAGIHGLQTIKNGDLEELSELGRGTFGTVYHGKWRGTDVAIKRIKESCFSGKPSERDRLTKDFWREAQILSQLHHPNVVALYGVVRDGPGGTLSTVTEYMANGSLRHVLSKRNRALDYRKRLIIAQDAAIGMEYLHLKNIVHFDLKCDNLLVNLGDPERPICKVGDFGLSRMKRKSLVSGGARGTLPWIAPELLDGSSTRVSEKVDVFSFGIAMWEILTGEEPYADMHCGAIIGGIVTNTLRPPIPRHCDHGWRVLMEKCWSNDPTDRPSFTQIANHLQAMSHAFQSKTQKRATRN
ncbi:unnamed protein product [Lactuca virosa]|uniref:Protein kinase domain-containing protein n=1 Tax=Lactuca virosa TaxID=75947 RepID=A0AAU9NEQ3_9ASTR|nr:unnamed protein product [Lactuca virosa]